MQEAQKAFFRREMARLQQSFGSSLDVLKEDLKDAREENNELTQKISGKEYTIYTLQNENEMFKEQITDLKLSVDNLEN